MVYLRTYKTGHKGVLSTLAALIITTKAVAIMTDQKVRNSAKEEKEVWKDIEGFDGDYKISGDGRLRSFKRASNGRLLKIRKGQAKLYRNDKEEKHSINKLVYETFGIDKLPNEIFKNVVGFEGLYKVSNKGRLFSLLTFMFMNPNKSDKGYYKVGLRKNNKSHTKILHRLIAKAFIANPENKKEVNHIDGDKSNNCIDNLEWCTPSENMQHAFDAGLIKLKSENSHFASLNNKQVLDIRNAYRLGVFSQAEIARAYDVSSTCIYAIVNRISWKKL